MRIFRLTSPTKFESSAYRNMFYKICKISTKSVKILDFRRGFAFFQSALTLKIKFREKKLNSIYFQFNSYQVKDINSDKTKSQDIKSYKFNINISIFYHISN